MKTCSRCNTLKPLQEYSKDYTFCKKCKREDVKNNPQYMIAQNKKRNIKGASYTRLEKKQMD
jgi:hypothetical protein